MVTPLPPSAAGHLPEDSRERIRQRVLGRIASLRPAPVVRAQSPSEEQMLRIWSCVLQRIAAPRTAGLFGELRSLASPPWILVERMRAAVLARIADVQPHPLWHWSVRLFATCTVFGVILRLAPLLFLAPVSRAEVEVTLLPTVGMVSVLEGGEWRNVDEATVLDGSTTVRTASKGEATIILGGHAVVRLAPRSDVTLYPPSFDVLPAPAQPAVRVSYGQVWVVGFLPQSLDRGLRITLPQGSILLKEGSLSTFVDPDQTTVQNFRRFVEVSPTSREPITLIEGEQVTLHSDVDPELHSITPEMRDERWVRQNLARDAAHLQDVIAQGTLRSIDQAGILPTSSLYVLKRLSEQLDLWMTISQERREEKQAQLAATRLREAIVLLRSGQTTAAVTSLEEFELAASSIAGAGDPFGRAQEVLAGAIADVSPSLAGALPDSPLFAVKRAMVISSLAPSPPGSPLVMDALFFDALLNVEELLRIGATTKAASLLSSLTPTIRRLLSSEDPAEKGQAKQVKSILRSLSLGVGEETTSSDPLALAQLRSLIAAHLPVVKEVVPVYTPPIFSQLDEGEIDAIVDRILTSVYTYKTARGQSNELTRQLKALAHGPDRQRVLTILLLRVPLHTRSIVRQELST